MGSDGSRYRILMVDDVTRYQTLYEMAITDALPAKVFFATNGEEALNRLKDPSPFDLLILDLNMPKLGGEETLRQIRQDPSYDAMPVIILTGETDPATHRRLLELGADDFVEKGAPPEIFVARLKAQIRHKLALDTLSRIAVDMDVFAAGVLHDIRNLETTILAICEITRDALAKDPHAYREQIRQDFTALANKAEALDHYAAEVITMVRESHKPLDLKPQDLQPLVEWAVKISDPNQPEVRLTCSFEGAFAPVLADKHFLQLVLLNLVQNSVKYRHPDRQPHIKVSQYCRRAGERQSLAKGHDLTAPLSLQSVQVTCLQDNGLGIKDSELRRVFEPFVRGSDRTKADGGFGLGLALVSKVMTSMGGRIWAERCGDEAGTRMCFELPSATAAEAMR